MGKKRQNKKKNKRVTHKAAHQQKQEVVDELIALEAVFADDFILHSDKQGFDLRVVPCPSEAEANHVSAKLSVRYGGAYPLEPPELELLCEGCELEEDGDELLAQLNQLATDLSQTRDVFMFSVIDLCQETLLSWNENIAAAQPCEIVEERTRSVRLEEMDLQADFFSQLRIGNGLVLFGESNISERPVPRKLSVNRSTTKRRQLSFDKTEKEGGASTAQDEALTAIAERTKAMPSKMSSESESATASDEEDVVVEEIHGTSVSRSMLSLVASMIDRVGPLPTYCVLVFDLSDECDVEMSKFKTEVLVGHLLKLATKSGSLTKESFPFLCGELHEKGILSGWLHWMLVKRPALFAKLFNKFFQKEIEIARQKTERYSSSDVGHVDSILTGFWLSSESHDEAEESKGLPSSRYRTDFEELRMFGKGGFGVVVAAVNRLDGRQYAVKKIKLTSTSLSAYTKIIREVATLARLQHPNVVRYFQAWLEPCTEADALTSEDSMDLDAYLESDSSGSPSVPHDTFSFSIQTKREQRASVIPEEVSDDGSTFVSATSDTPHAEDEQTTENLQTNPFSICFEPGSKSRTVENPYKTRRQSEREAQHQVLYIQMEACNRTLQEATILQSQRKLEEHERWEILRQILLGLSYIHSQRIVHRDLKPPNIFYSSAGEVKLGDFGLAKFSTAAGDASVKDGGAFSEGPVSTPSRQSIANEASGICGTSFYIAPEIQNRWPSYDTKVDMYSLGIVVFEMWHPFNTGMERILTLKELKEKGTLPSKWKSQNPIVAKVVVWLLSANPSNRPTAKELLRSDYLPPRVGDEQLEDLIRSLQDDIETYGRVIEGVFRSSKATKRSEVPGIMVSDLAGAPCMQHGSHVEIQDRICATVKEVFSMHGAVRMTSQDVGLCDAHVPLDGVKVISTSGDLYALKYDMRYPFVEWVAGEIEKAESGIWDGSSGTAFPIDNLRRYDVGRVSREGPGLTFSKSYLQADIDFITAPLPRITEEALKDSVHVQKILSEQLLAEAEIVKIISEVMNGLKLAETEHVIEIRLTHMAFLHACIKQVSLTPVLLSQSLQHVSMAGRFSPIGSARSDNWTSIQTALEGLGLFSSAIRSWRRFVTKLSGQCDIVLPQLISALSNNGQAPVSPAVLLAFEELKSLISLLEKWRLSGDQIVMDPVMSPESDYYSGVYFQVHLVHPTKRTSTLVAIGGRYDKLLNAALLRRNRNLTGASARYGLVGGTINLKPFIKKETESYNAQNPQRSTSSDVLVCSKSGGSAGLESRMELISHLWRNGIRAEMLHRVAPSMTAHYDYAVSSGIRILVTIDEKLSSSETVKVKHLDRRNEEDVRFDALVPYIQSILQSRIPHASSRK